jgi:lysine 2,3-aminomutase
VKNVRHITDVNELWRLLPHEREELEEVQNRFAFKATSYYLDLINWDDPYDPLRRIIVPHADELSEWGEADPSDEASITSLPGLQHKYTHTALLLLSESCACYCRYCFRKRVFHKDNREIREDVEDGIRYIKEHSSITNVLLTGGDPLMLSTKRLTEVIGQIREIPHVKIVRIGSKVPAYWPQRILEDGDLLEMFRRFSTPERRMYLMCHFSHPRELTDVALVAADVLLKAGVILCNQTPIIRGVNDSSLVLAKLLNKLSATGITPYYLFQCRPTKGNLQYSRPIVEAYFIIEHAKRFVHGLGKRTRFVMSHELGKIEIVSVTASHIYLKFHRAKDRRDEGRFLVFRRDDSAYWYDDLLAQESSVDAITTGAPHMAKGVDRA